MTRSWGFMRLAAVQRKSSILRLLGWHIRLTTQKREGSSKVAQTFVALLGRLVWGWGEVLPRQALFFTLGIQHTQWGVFFSFSAMWRQRGGKWLAWGNPRQEGLVRVINWQGWGDSNWGWFRHYSIFCAQWTFRRVTHSLLCSRLAYWLVTHCFIILDSQFHRHAITSLKRQGAILFILTKGGQSQWGHGYLLQGDRLQAPVLVSFL